MPWDPSKSKDVDNPLLPPWLDRDVFASPSTGAEDSKEVHKLQHSWRKRDSSDVPSTEAGDAKEVDWWQHPWVKEVSLPPSGRSFLANAHLYCLRYAARSLYHC